MLTKIALFCLGSLAVYAQVPTIPNDTFPNTRTAINASFTAAVPTTLTVTGATGLTGGGALSANRTITCLTASASVFGCLPSADWSTFNGKGLPASEVQSTFSTTPTPTCPTGSSTAGTVVTFTLSTVLSANVTWQTLTGCKAGQLVAFRHTQGSGTTFTVTFPTGFSEAGAMSLVSNDVQTQLFEWDGSAAHLLLNRSTLGPLVSGAEQAAPGTPGVGIYSCWPDSTDHQGIECKANNSSTVYKLVATGADVNTSNGQVTVTHLASALPVNQGGTGTVSTLTGLMRGNSSAMTAAEISGDCATSGSNALTCTKVNGVSSAASPATDTVQVVTASNTRSDKAMPDCLDSSGNHINYTASTHAFSCGTSSSGGGGAAGATLFSTTGSTTATATSATTLIGTATGSTTVATNTFTAGQVLHISAQGYYSTPATPASLTIDLKIGGTTRITTGAVVQLASVTNGVWNMTCDITTRTTGGSGTQIANCIFVGTGSTLTPGEAPMFTNSTWTVDTTATNAIDIQATWSTATGSPTITSTNVSAWIPGAPVSSFSGDGTLISNSGSTGAITATLATAAAHKAWMNNTGSTAAPGYQSIGTADLPAALANQTSINGVTRPSSGNSGGVTCWTSSSVEASSGALTANVYLVGGGTGICPSSLDPAFTTQTDGATITWAIGSAVVANASVTLGGSRTLNITGPKNGGSYVLKVVQDGTGSRGLTLGTGCTWKVSGGGAGAITPTTTASAIDILAFTYDGTNCYANFNKNFN